MSAIDPPIVSNSDSPPPAPLSPVSTRAIFLLLGVGVLVPWNAFVSAKPYFQARLCQDGVVLIDFELWFGLVWNMSSVFSLGLIVSFVAVKDALTISPTTEGETSRILADDPISTEISSTERSGSIDNNWSTDLRSESVRQGGHSFWLVMVPLGLYLMVFSVTDLFVLLPDLDPHTFALWTLAGLAICGTCGAIATAGIVSTAGLFESHLGIGPFFSGQALGGVAVSTANFVAATMEDPHIFWEQRCEGVPSNQQIVTDTTFPVYHFYDDFRTDFHDRILGKDSTGVSTSCSPYTELDWALFGYFFAGCVVLAACLAGYAVIDRRQPQQRRDDYEVVHDTQLSETPLDEQSPRQGSEMKDQRNVEQANEEMPTAATSAQSAQSPSYHDDGDINPDLSLPCFISGVIEATTPTPFEDEFIEQPEEYTEEENEMAVFSAIKGPAICVFLVFSSTLSLFPGFISQLRSAHQCDTRFRLANDLYLPMSFVLFNVGDLTGRLLSERVPVTHIHNLSGKLVAAALSRLVLLPPLFLLCVAQDPRSWVVSSDVYSLAVQLFFAVTNGILVSCSFMHSPHLVAQKPGMQERASELMTFAVFFGLLTGSLLSFPFSKFASNL